MRHIEDGNTVCPQLPDGAEENLHVRVGQGGGGFVHNQNFGMRVPGTKGILSKGVPGFVFRHTDEFFPNDLEDLERKLRRNKLDGGTAAVYLEPVGPESGTWPVSKEFVKGAALLAHEYGALLIFDEVVTGFRIGPSGAQGFFGVDPDLTVFGKIVAGGYPGAGGVGGHRDCMDQRSREELRRGMVWTKLGPPGP